MTSLQALVQEQNAELALMRANIATILNNTAKPPAQPVAPTLPITGVTNLEEQGNIQEEDIDNERIYKELGSFDPNKINTYTFIIRIRRLSA